MSNVLINVSLIQSRTSWQPLLGIKSEFQRTVPSESFKFVLSQLAGFAQFRPGQLPLGRDMKRLVGRGVMCGCPSLLDEGGKMPGGRGGISGWNLCI